MSVKKYDVNFETRKEKFEKDLQEFVIPHGNFSLYGVQYDYENGYFFRMPNSIAKTISEGVEYFAMIPAEESEMDGEFCEYVILKEIVEDGETTLVEVDDDKEFQEMADIFDDLFDEEIDYDAEAPKK